MFVDYSIKGYSGQYNVQVSAVIKFAVDTVQDRHPAAKKVIIQSDNSSGFASQEIFPFVFNINTRLENIKKLVFNRWIFTVAQTGKTRLDTHYSFPNKTIQAYVEDDKEILIEYDVLKDIIFNEGISSTTDILVDLVSLFVKISLKINKFKIRTGARETHELCWRKDSVELTK